MKKILLGLPVITASLVFGTFLKHAIAEDANPAQTKPKYQKLEVKKADQVFKVSREEQDSLNDQNARAFKNSSPEVQRALLEAYKKSRPKQNTASPQSQ